MEKEEIKKLIEQEAEKCKNDPAYVPEIKTGNKEYTYIKSHKAGGKLSHNPSCDLIWYRIKKGGK